MWRSSTAFGFRAATSSSLQPTSLQSGDIWQHNHVPLKPPAKARIKSVAYANPNFRNGFFQPLSFHSYVWSTYEEGFKIRFWSRHEIPHFTGLQRRQPLRFCYQRASNHGLLLGCDRCDDKSGHFRPTFSVIQSLVATSPAKWSPKSPSPLPPRLLVLLRSMRSQVYGLDFRSS